MTIVELREILHDVTYKTNFKWNIEEEKTGTPWSTYRLKITMMTADARTPKQGIEIARTVFIEPICFTKEGQFLDFVQRQFETLEIHESREHFRYKGNLTNDPHRDEDPD